MRKFSTTLLAGLTLALATPATAEITMRKLERLDKLVSTNDCKGLFSFLSRNKELTRGNDSLAIELAPARSAELPAHRAWRIDQQYRTQRQRSRNFIQLAFHFGPSELDGPGKFAD